MRDAVHGVVVEAGGAVHGLCLERVAHVDDVDVREQHVAAHLEEVGMQCKALVRAHAVWIQAATSKSRRGPAMHCVVDCAVRGALPGAHLEPWDE